MTHDESSSNPLAPADDAVESSTSDDETLSDIVSEQDEQAQKFAAEFLKMVIRLRGVQIDRDDYLRQELRKLGTDDNTVALALETTPGPGWPHPGPARRSCGRHHHLRNP